MEISVELSHAIVSLPFFFFQLVSCWNLLPQRKDRKKNLIFLTSIFSFLIIIYSYILFTKGFDFATNIVFFLLTIPGLIMYFIISKYRDGRLIFCYFFSDSILSIINFLSYAICLHFLTPRNLEFSIIRMVSFTIPIILFNIFYIPTIREALDTKHVNWNIIASISAFAGVYIYYELVSCGSILEREDELFRISLTFILLAIVFLTLLWTLVKIREKEKQEIEFIKKENSNNIMKLQMKQVEVTYKQVNETYEKIRFLRHDINKKLAVLDGLYKKEEYDKLGQFLEKLIKEVPENNIKKFTSNILLNSIINYYLQQMQKEQIKFECKLILPDLNDNISSDICIILGNALDNAIQANIKVEKERFISLKGNYNKSNILLSIENSFNKDLIIEEKGKLKTTKKDSSNHGLGLEIIEKIASSYEGYSINSRKNNVFKLDIMLHL